MSGKKSILDRIGDLPIKAQMLYPIAALLLVAFSILGAILFRASDCKTTADIYAVRVQGIVALVIIFILVYFSIGNGIRVISKDLKELKSYAEKIAHGDTDFTITLHKKSETGMTVNEFENMRSTIQSMLRDVNNEKNDILQGNLQNRIDASAYEGDYQQIVTGMNELVDSVSGMIRKIDTASQNIAASSKQISDGAQELSQGTTEQAGSIEELSATMSEISKQIKSNAGNTSAVSQLAVKSSEEVARGNDLMKQMIAAMEKINESSSQISSIVKTIEDIAFQTNILALNAAVEAARAGAAGKGFAVVADEVKNLANKSSEAVKSTTAFIEETITAVENGTKIAQTTAESLNSITGSTNKMTELIKNISNATSEQALSISQVTQGMGQISAVVQKNSATSEESAASSEELSKLAQALKALVQKYKLAA